MNKIKLSLNKFGEYFTATPYRKETIIREAKYNKESERGARYSKARKAIRKYFLSGFDKQIINDAIAELNTLLPKSEWQKSDKESSIQALKKVLEFDFKEFDKYTFAEYKSSSKSIEVEGVEISINPDLILKMRDKNDSLNIGSVKIHLSKNNELKDEAIKNVSTMLYQFLNENIVKEDEEVKPAMSFSYDVFSSNIGVAPTSISRRWKNIEATCRSIKLYWDSI